MADTYLRLQKEKEELDDITTELELADEDDLVPYVYSRSGSSLYI